MAKSLLGANADAQDAFLQGKQSLYVGKRPFKMSNQFRRYEDFSPNGSSAWGSIMTYEPQQTADLLGMCYLIVTNAAATSTAATGDYPRFIDWVGYLMIKECRVLHSSNQIQKFGGLDLYITDLIRLRSEDSYATQVGGGIGDAAAAANAQTAGNETIVPLSLLAWVGKVANNLPYNIEVVRRRLQINIELESVYNVITTDGSDLAQTIESVLRCEQIHVTADERSAMFAETETVNAALGIEGWARVVTIVDNHPDVTVAAQTTAQTVKLSQLRLPTKEIIYTSRDPADLFTGALNDAQNPANFQALTAYTLRAFNENVHPRYTSKFAQAVMNDTHSGPTDVNVYSSPLGHAPESQEQFGYLNFNSVSDPNLLLEISDTDYVNLHLTIPTHGVLAITGGDIRMIYA